MLNRIVAPLAGIFLLVLLTATPAAAQVIGTFKW